MFKQVIASILPQSYWIKRNLKRIFSEHKQLVLVHQMGKVGSSSVYFSLRKHLDQPVYQTHFLSALGIKEASAFFSRCGNSIPYNIQFSKQLNSFIPLLGKVKIVTLVRDPIAREISDYFQLGKRIYPLLCNEKRYSKEILDSLKEKVTALTDPNHYTYQWFKREVAEVFGLDVYQTPFDYRNGYIIIKKANIDICILRLENLNQCFKSAMKKFFNTNYTLYLEKHNLTDEKEHAAIYRNAKDNLHISKTVVDTIYDSDFAIHFYSDLAPGLKQRWTTESLI